MLEYHLDQMGFVKEPYRTADDSATGGMERHDERKAIRKQVEAYVQSLRVPAFEHGGQVRVLSAGAVSVQSEPLE